MAHTRHTNEPGDAYRLGWGDVTTPTESVAAARSIYLHVAGELYPAMGEELCSIGASLPEPLPTDPAYLEPEELAVLERWCIAWKLAQKGAVVDWALRAALDSIAQWRATGSWLWCVSWGGGIPSRPEGSYDPTLWRLSVEKQRRPRGEHKAMSAATSEYLDAGFIETPKRWQPEHVRWAVQYIVGEMSFAEIFANAKTALSNRNDPEPYVRLRTLEVLREIGLPSRRQRGRPKRPT